MMFQNAGIGMLRNEAGAQHLDSLAGNPSTIEEYSGTTTAERHKLLNFRA